MNYNRLSKTNVNIYKVIWSSWWPGCIIIQYITRTLSDNWIHFTNKLKNFQSNDQSATNGDKNDLLWAIYTFYKREFMKLNRLHYIVEIVHAKTFLFNINIDIPITCFYSHVHFVSMSLCFLPIGITIFDVHASNFYIKYY